ncbi:hypothetical protein IWX87_001631 [Polaromonas sp. CG_9.7]|nr:hypothetical protein [Polaromonas sp. CG_9.7]MBG6113880.1 hypothetical protein [Polaromonas sp. CG_9.2]MDH6183797.1 hypothetical protein [Polaromonas sp. CG_23.6]
MRLRRSGRTSQRTSPDACSSTEKLPNLPARAANSEILRDVLHNTREDVMVRIGMGRKASFLANSCAINKKATQRTFR